MTRDGNKRKPAVFYDPGSLRASETIRSALHTKYVVVEGREALVTLANFTDDWVRLGIGTD